MPEQDRIRTLIVDDEPVARRMIRHLLENDDEVEVVGESFGAQAVHDIEELRPDVVFLDVNMPQMDGFEVLQAVGTRPLPLVVFVTAYDEHAIRAFELRALDYLLKPYSDRRLFSALARVKETLRNRETEAAQRRLLALLTSRLSRDAGQQVLSLDPSPPVRRTASQLIARDGNRTVFVPTPEILWIEADGVYARIHARSGEQLVRTSLGGLEEQLDPESFFRIHRSAVVNIEWVVEVHHLSHGDYTVLLRDGTELKLSRTRREEFEAWLGMVR